MFLRKIINKLRTPKHLRSSNNYIDYLRSKGIKVGDGTIIFSTRDINIDISRPELVEIGKKCFLHRGTTIMTHDWAGWCFVNEYNDFIPSHGRVTIGNNVWLGQNVSILKGVKIGDNVIIGYGSIVTKDIPSNSVAVGSPAKVIMSFEEYYKKRTKSYVDEAVEYAIEILKSGRVPNVSDFYDDYPAFVDGENYKDYDYPYNRVFNDKQFDFWIRNHKAQFRGFEEFMNYVYAKRNDE